MRRPKESRGEIEEAIRLLMEGFMELRVAVAALDRERGKQDAKVVELDAKEKALHEDVLTLHLKQENVCTRIESITRSDQPPKAAVQIVHETRYTGDACWTYYFPYDAPLRSEDKKHLIVFLNGQLLSSEYYALTDYGVTVGQLQLAGTPPPLVRMGDNGTLAVQENSYSYGQDEIVIVYKSRELE